MAKVKRLTVKIPKKSTRVVAIASAHDPHVVAAGATWREALQGAAQWTARTGKNPTLLYLPKPDERHIYVRSRCRSIATRS